MQTTDVGVSSASLATVFSIVRAVEQWPRHLTHYRWVKMTARDSEGGGIVEMSANRPFGALNWPTWWRSEMTVDDRRPALLFRHIGGVTRGMDVEWAFFETAQGTAVRLVHEWAGPDWPLIGTIAANAVIGPVFVHGIASRTIAGLLRAAERNAQ